MMLVTLFLGVIMRCSWLFFFFVNACILAHVPEPSVNVAPRAASSYKSKSSIYETNSLILCKDEIDIVNTLADDIHNARIRRYSVDKLLPSKKIADTNLELCKNEAFRRVEKRKQNIKTATRAYLTSIPYQYRLNFEDRKLNEIDEIAKFEALSGKVNKRWENFLQKNKTPTISTKVLQLREIKGDWYAHSGQNSDYVVVTAVVRNSNNTHCLSKANADITIQDNEGNVVFTDTTNLLVERRHYRDLTMGGVSYSEYVPIWLDPEQASNFEYVTKTPVATADIKSVRINIKTVEGIDGYKCGYFLDIPKNIQINISVCAEYFSPQLSYAPKDYVEVFSSVQTARTREFAAEIVSKWCYAYGNEDITRRDALHGAYMELQREYASVIAASSK